MEFNDGSEGIKRKSIQSTLEIASAIFDASDTSNVIDCGGYSLIGFYMPSDFVGVTLSFQSSIDGVTNFVDMYNTAGSKLQLVVTPATATYVALLPVDLFPARYLKLVSSAVESTTVIAMTKGA